ncbi:hypothetical protein [Marimonas arenosa]|nr:hypothetical protein [Marimonas arenosa]
MTNYREELPDGCPPPSANEDALADVWRFIQGQSPVESDFDSHAKLGKPNRKGASECDFASCSLFDTKAAKNMAKNQFFKRKFASRLDIPASSGKHLANSKGHVHLWMYDEFDPVKAVVETVKL